MDDLSWQFIAAHVWILGLPTSLRNTHFVSLFISYLLPLIRGRTIQNYVIMVQYRLPFFLFLREKKKKQLISSWNEHLELQRLSAFLLYLVHSSFINELILTLFLQGVDPII